MNQVRSAPIGFIFWVGRGISTVAAVSPECADRTFWGLTCSMYFGGASSLSLFLLLGLSIFLGLQRRLPRHDLGARRAYPVLPDHHVSLSAPGVTAQHAVGVGRGGKKIGRKERNV